MAGSGDIIVDRSLPAVQRIADLAKNTTAPGKLMLVEDEEPLVNAVRAGLRFVSVYALTGSDVPPSVVDVCDEYGLRLDRLDSSLAKDLFRTDKCPKVFGVARTPRTSSAQDLVSSSRDLLILDGVRIVGNIGAICRSAVAFGVSGIVLVDSGLKSVADRRLVRASRGYVFSLPVAVLGWGEVEDVLASAGLDAVALDAGGAETVEVLTEVPGRLAFVLGAETSGLSPVAQRLCSRSVSIAMDAAVESLNVSVSAGVLMQIRSHRNLALL